MNPQRSEEDEVTTPPSAPVLPLQMQALLAQVQAPIHPQQPTVVSNLTTDKVLGLLSEAKDAFFVCEELGLQEKRALACTCSTLRLVIFQLLRQPRLVVQESDAILDNARFVASVLVPNVPKQVLCVAGETCVPNMNLAHLRTLPKLKVGTMGPTAALFLGAAIADSDCVLRLSTGATKSIRALRENDRVNFQMPDIAQPSDRNAMLGALTLNAEQDVTVVNRRHPTLAHACMYMWATQASQCVTGHSPTTLGLGQKKGYSNPNPCLTLNQDGLRLLEAVTAKGNLLEALNERAQKGNDTVTTTTTGRRLDDDHDEDFGGGVWSLVFE